MRLRNFAVAAVLSILAGCGSDGPTSPTLPVTFSGLIVVRNGATIPANARVLALWGVSATSPDYSYVYGSGTLTSSGTFTITFDAEPPAEALNNGQLGVALIIITTDQTLAAGKVPAGYTFPGVLGMTEDYSVIFTKNLSSELAKDWPGRFSGYGAGQVERATSGFDSFKSVDRDGLRLIIDDLAKIHPPNWT